MNSYDVFDTLIARRFINNDELLLKIETQLGIKGFAKHRRKADNGKRNIFEIYRLLVESDILTNKVAEQALLLEYSLEIENSFPIGENIKRVNHGDVLISDMYFTGPMILKMVREAGLSKQVTIYQSNSDKHSGKIWQNFHPAPNLHLGDNVVSDYENPKKAGINAELYPGTNFNASEERLLKDNFKYLSLMIREIRLRLTNSFSNRNFLDPAISFNLPSLIILSELIYRRNKGIPITFLGRDCQLLEKIYSTYFSTTESIYLPFSRKVALLDSKLAVEYLETHSLKNSTLFDLNSTGTTWHYINQIKKFNVQVAIYLNNQSYIKGIKQLPVSFSYITENNGIISNILYEIFNAADHGSIVSLEKRNGLILSKYGNTELDSNIIKDIQKPTYLCLELSKFYKDNIRKELSNFDDITLINVYRDLVSKISSLKKPLAPHLTNIFQIEKEHINYLNHLDDK